MSNVLVIHPKDESTDFLARIYDGKDYDVYTGYDRSVVCDLIDGHDKIIMMGHGTPSGLMNPGAFVESNWYNMSMFLVDRAMVRLLKDKETISIWCNSDQFFKNNNFGQGELHTGMVVSETAEQQYVFGKVYLNKEEQLENMNRFADAVRLGIDSNGEELKQIILDNYIGEDPVTKFNRKNIIVL